MSDRKLVLIELTDMYYLKNKRLFHFGFLFCSPKYWLWPVQSPHLQGELIDGFFALDMVLLGEQVWEYVVPLDTR